MIPCRSGSGACTACAGTRPVGGCREATSSARAGSMGVPTPLGCPVVPEVKRMRASSSSAKPRVVGATALGASTRRGAIMTPTLNFDSERPAPIWFVQPRRDFGRLHAARVSISNGGNAVDGPAHAPTTNANSSAKNSLQLPKWMNTRSPRLVPPWLSTNAASTRMCVRPAPSAARERLDQVANAEVQKHSWILCKAWRLPPRSVSNHNLLC